jgi:hypothetical protein
MLRGYWDESGSADDPSCRFMGIGGLIASPESWSLIEAQWRVTLDDYALPYFHMREFAHWSGNFKQRSDWPEARRRELMSRLLGAIAVGQPRVHGAVIDLAAWRLLDKKYREAFVAPWYCCFQECARIASVYGVIDKVDMEMIFAQQAEFAGKAMPLYDSIRQRQDKGYDGFTRFAMEDMRNVLPLQSADLVAYELVKFAGHVEDVGEEWETLKPRAPFRGLLQIDRHAYVANIDAAVLRAQCEGVDLAPSL